MYSYYLGKLMIPKFDLTFSYYILKSLLSPFFQMRSQNCLWLQRTYIVSFTEFVVLYALLSNLVMPSAIIFLLSWNLSNGLVKNHKWVQVYCATTDELSQSFNFTLLVWGEGNTKQKGYRRKLNTCQPKYCH